jgi:hypothetical protein
MVLFVRKAEEAVPDAQDFGRHSACRITRCLSGEPDCPRRLTPFAIYALLLVLIIGLVLLPLIGAITASVIGAQPGAGSTKAAAIPASSWARISAPRSPPSSSWAG